MSKGEKQRFGTSLAAW